MSDAVIKSTKNNSTHSKDITRKTLDKIDVTLTDELIIGICSPIGTHRKICIDMLKEILEKDYKYDVKIIKLSDKILQYTTKKIEIKEKHRKEFTELMFKIKAGDELRSKYNMNSILAELAIQTIRLDREKEETENIKGKRVCYIIDSLKHFEELEILKKVYRDIFYLFSIYSPRSEKEKNLADKNLSRSEIKEIIEIDEKEDDVHGQNVRKIFVEADFFVRISKVNMNTLEQRVKKYLHLIFESKIQTPDKNEIAMYHAKSAAGNSACLSRQVGAAICNEKGDIISRGWNDVPKFGGNLYSYSDENDHRCYSLGYCSNDKHKHELIGDITNKILSKFTKQKELFDINVQDERINIIHKIISESGIKNLIEFSRSIHAEMHAIISGAQLSSDKMINGSIYVTTYPCHNCARHIAVAGIKKIFYIEPYKKSLGTLLHNDSITEDESDKTKVQILLYDGVAPSRFLDFYIQKNERKDDTNGKLIKIDLGTVKPRHRLSLQAIPVLENQAIDSLKKIGIFNGEAN